MLGESDYIVSLATSLSTPSRKRRGGGQRKSEWRRTGIRGEEEKKQEEEDAKVEAEAEDSDRN